MPKSGIDPAVLSKKSKNRPGKFFAAPDGSYLPCGRSPTKL
jgi:hypothetical protein